jgi:hypothetical protein
MRQKVLPILATFLLLVGLQGCSDDGLNNAGIPKASVTFDFWAGARNVEVDGEIFNDGRTFIESVELEILLYDEFDHYINSTFQTFWVNLEPQQSFLFATDLRESDVYTVEVVIHNVQ